MRSLRTHDRCGCVLRGAAFVESAHAAAKPFAFAHSPRNFERDRPFRVTHIALDLTLEVSTRSIAGVATLSIDRSDETAKTLTLDAVGFEITSVKLDGAPHRTRYDGRALTLDVPLATKHASVEIAYRATPRRGMYFIEPDAHYPDRPRQVWTQFQEEDARHVFPCHDKPHMKMTFELEVHVPAGWRALSNGELVGEKARGDRTSSFRWKMNDALPSYLVTIVAGEFTVENAHAGEIPVSYWVPTGRAKDIERTFGRTPQMVTFFGDLLGVRYPWNKYAQVVVSDFIFGGMENTTATTMYEHVLLDERAAVDITSDDIIAHELAHQWFGDYVTCRDWSEGWLNEGFATYMEHVWREHHLGADEYDYGLKADLDGYAAEARGRYRRPIVCQEYDAPLDLFDRHLYEKGALTLHALRVALGKETFFKGVSAYLKQHGRGVVETRDLMRALEDTSGKSVGRFFDQTVYKPGHPELEIAYSWDDGVLTFAVKQVQQAQDGVPAAFDFALAVVVEHDHGNAETHRLHVTQRSENFSVPSPDRPRFVVVDPDMGIVGEIHVSGPADMLRAQLAHGKRARFRWLAALALSKTDDPTSIAALAGALSNEREFWGVRVECASALGRIRGQESFDALAKSTHVVHPKARRAVADALGAFKTPQALEVLRPLALGDVSYMAQAEAARSLGKTRQPAAVDLLVGLLERSSWADVVRVGALDGLAETRDERALPHVLARTKYGHPARARRAAILAVPKISQDRRARETLEELLDDADPSLRVDVARALGELADLRARPALRARLDVDLDPRVRRRIREVLRDLGGEGKRATDTLRERLDKLEEEHATLKTRLAKIEAAPRERARGRAKKKVTTRTP